MAIGTTRSRLTLAAAAGIVVAATLAAPGGVALSADRAAEEDAAAGSRPKQVLFEDTYDNGFTTGETGNWMVLGDEEWPTGDGTVTTPGGTLNVVPTGTNPETGEPAYARSSPQQDDGGTGSSDHIKWIAFPNRYTENGTPGFEVPDTGSVSCQHLLQGETYGTEDHPFGDAVEDPENDIRLASLAVIGADFESRAILDFSVTNSTIYAIYERLPSETGDQSYAAYSYAIPVAERTPGEYNDLEIRIDQGGRRATWLVDGQQELQTDQIGTHAFDREYMTVDHGGTEELLTLNQISCGLALGSLLDGALPGSPDGTALVKLDSIEDHYYDPRQGEPEPQTFLDPESREENRLWGQGVELNVEWTRVVRR